MASVSAPIQVGTLLRSWRRRRSLSQLELALDADVSTRHISFLETGRSRPSRDMVLRLAEQLDVPLRERNELLLAAGYAPIYEERTLTDAEMSPVRDALNRFLRAHEPYPALVIDRQHDLVAANDAAGLLLEGVDPELLAEPANVLRIALHPRGMAPRTMNLAEWSSQLLRRLRREAHLTGDERLDRLHDELARYPGVDRGGTSAEIDAAEILLPLRIRDRDGTSELSLFSTIATFGSPADITISELAIEAFYPANARTATRLLEEIGAG
jgi:transcriptional regulator with XRE-family HTH domain